MPGPPGRKGQSSDLRLFNGSVNMANNEGRIQLPIMVRSGKKSQKPFWPFMELWGLYRKAITPDGNCLFRALSDQMYNTTDRHDEIRQKVVEHLRSNRQDFEAFVPFNTEEPWVRSQPSTRSSRLRREIDADDWFEAYLKDMARPKTWGGEIEIRAFCEAFDRDVLIHRPTNAGQPFDQMINMKRGDGQPRQFVHVSYGGEENHPHYESVRPLKATGTAVPSAPNLSFTSRGSLCGPADGELSLSDYNMEQLNRIQQARPSLSSEELHAFLERSRSQLDKIFAQIINTDRERSSSASSASQQSSSSKRSREDDEESGRTSKRPLRPISCRNRTSAFVKTTAPVSSLHGTEVCFQVRIDTPPSTPIQSQPPKMATAEQQERLDVGCEGLKEEPATQGREPATQGREPATQGREPAPREKVATKADHPTRAETPAQERVADAAIPPSKTRAGNAGPKTKAKDV